eukprot:GGOE01031716.1.p1 GENE.GGOE01031716.1~~GGOE01031716.1.p1  ORF type:complete len:385 (+),score=108.70 GGOE01031716.1:42-1196(+)
MLHIALRDTPRSAMPPCPVAAALACTNDATPVVGTIVNVAGCHHEALQYANTIFHSSPVVSDTHGGRLKVQGLLGQGSWSVVYRVTEMVQRKNFALKVVPQQGTHITSYYEDIRKLSKLKHPNIIEMYNHFLFQEDDSPCPLLCIRLELCRFSMEQYIQHKGQKQRPILTIDLCMYMTQLASALAYIHRQGMLHGDVRSANVLLTMGPAPGSMAVRLTNFGSSQRTVQQGATALTITGGSRAYAPPEWVNSTPLRRPLTPLETPLPSYDLWGLGCMLGEMATMKLILGDRLSRTSDSLAANLCCLEALKEEMAHVHEGMLADLCSGLLEVNPDDRLGVEEVCSHLPITSSLQATPPAKRGGPSVHLTPHISSLLRPLSLFGRRH